MTSDLSVSTAQPPRDPVSITLIKLAVVLVAAAACCTLLVTHHRHFNGMPFHHYVWQTLAAGRIYPAMLLAAAPAILAQVVKHRRLALGLLIASTLGMELVDAGMPREPWDIGRVAEIVGEPNSTGYFSDATVMVQQPSIRQWVGHFVDYIPYFHPHSRQKPPGQIFYYVLWLKAFGLESYGSAALMGGLGVMILATASVPAAYWMALKVTEDRAAAFATASYFALCPALTLVLPSFDQVYPAATGLIVGAWLVALQSDRSSKRIAAAVVCGCATAAVSFFAYSPLTLGLLCVALGSYELWRKPNSGKRIALLAAIVLATISAAYGVLWVISGFDPIQMFRIALVAEQSLQSGMIISRAWPRTLVWDLRDFMLGEGWLSVPLLFLGLWRLRSVPRRATILLCIGQVLVVWASGLLRAETVRVWLFMQPLMLLLIGIELSRWPRWGQIAVLVVLTTVTTCVAQNICFIADAHPPPQPAADVGSWFNGPVQ